MTASMSAAPLMGVRGEGGGHQSFISQSLSDQPVSSSSASHPSVIGQSREVERGSTRGAIIRRHSVMKLSHQPSVTNHRSPSSASQSPLTQSPEVERGGARGERASGGAGPRSAVAVADKHQGPVLAGDGGTCILS